MAQNAYETMSEGGVLTIGIESVDSTMRVWFEDDGEGIKEEEIGRVLGQLFTTDIQGTGLGLAVCHQ